MVAAQALVPVLSSPDQPLQELQLGHNRLGDAGASALAQGLLRNASLTKLGLGHNGPHSPAAPPPRRPAPPRAHATAAAAASAAAAAAAAAAATAAAAAAAATLRA